jgi:dimeric dUTPase (all-alpha-NTP-PPase superfamily)
MNKKIILQLLLENGDLSIKELVDVLNISKQAIHRLINQLLDEDAIIKLGRVPKTIYRLKTNQSERKEIVDISDENGKFLDQNFLLITEVGEMKEGLDGFEYWCKQRQLPIEKTISEYINTLQKYSKYYNPIGIINGMEKLNNTSGFSQIHLNDLFYLDFYEIERFGKTRLGTLLHYAKQGQNKFLMKILTIELKPKLEKLLKNGDYDAIGFVPPTIRREVQIMKYLETHLNINLPKIKIQKISGIIPVPQKSLNKMDERIRNAENTFSIPETIKYNHILLIDDAVGSGSTLNQIAGKIKQKGIANKITGLAIVGSFKGFDVVTDV